MRIVGCRPDVCQGSDQRKERVMFDPDCGSGPVQAHSACPRRSSISFPATASQITSARQFLQGFLSDSPLAADAVLCLSEVATNSVIHSKSRCDGGRFTINVERYDNNHVRVEVKDHGGPWIQRTKPEGQLSLGLRIVGRLARDWGITNTNDSARTVWFEVGPVRSPAQAAA
jgi:anti-sigma regulatory factor (Ser/Thr protein kinase)